MDFAISATDSGYSPSSRFFENDTALGRLLSEAPYLSRCSDNKTAARVRPREYAIRHPYMQVNRYGMVSWLIFDLDHSNSLIWDDEGLPAPNLVVRNRTNGHSHLYYAIHTVCTTDNARSKPINYMKAIYAAFAARLVADPAYSGPVAKTPGHPWWDTAELHNHVYELGDLADYVDLAVTPWRSAPKLDDVSHSRHCILFEQMRFFAYSIVNQQRDTGSFGAFMRLLEAFAHNHNSFHKHGFTENLPLSSLRATIRSIARWTWDRYQGGGSCHRGVMQLDKDLPLAERQSLAAKRTHEVRNKATESKIRAACAELRARGERLRQTAIALIAKVSRQTVATYAHVLKEPLRAAVTALRGSVAGTDLDVKHGVHQIPAARSAALDLCLKGNNQAFDGECGTSDHLVSIALGIGTGLIPAVQGSFLGASVAQVGCSDFSLFGADPEAIPSPSWFLDVPEPGK
ncbi:replication initiation protein [Pseudomonas sp. P5_152]|uniref:replication initiation protein n=1 Tax=Pseudomonas sp. P5_152 TaxID=3043442 RepID=UPI002A448934|nr:replication initiation protein [Pseudomonas sp. P5_152]